MEIRQILVPIDGSALSLRAAEAAASLAERLGASITLMIAYEPPEASLEYVSPAALEEVARGLWQASDAMLEQAAERIRPRLPRVEKRIVRGSPVQAILSAAEWDHDLIVMGSRGMGLHPSDRHLLGSVAERVIQRAHCPVMVITAHADSSA